MPPDYPHVVVELSVVGGSNIQVNPHFSTLNTQLPLPDFRSLLRNVESELKKKVYRKCSNVDADETTFLFNVKVVTFLQYKRLLILTSNMRGKEKGKGVLKQ